tara:strand:- start:85 stop:1086 length:1002 start_codon:yes stop_codon:yes gene_type:complete
MSSITKQDNQSCWIITDGSAGMENQALGLSEHINVNPVCLRVPKPPLHNLIRPHWMPIKPLVNILHNLTECNSDKIELPKILISCGHKSVAYAIAVKKYSRKKTFTIHIQNPLIPPKMFNLIIAPQHDKLIGSNIIESQGALHRINDIILSQSLERFSEQFINYPKPIIAVLIGGSTRRYKFDSSAAISFAAELAYLAQKKGGSVLISGSRRTDLHVLNALKNGLKETPGFVWDGQGANPYTGFLAHADFIITTCDSVTMTSEAISTGKPTYIYKLKGKGSARFERFFEDIINSGYARWYKDSLDSWQYNPPRETERIGKLVKNIIEDYHTKL